VQRGGGGSREIVTSLPASFSIRRFRGKKSLGGGGERRTSKSLSSCLCFGCVPMERGGGWRREMSLYWIRVLEGGEGEKGGWDGKKFRWSSGEREKKKG